MAWRQISKETTAFGIILTVSIYPPLPVNKMLPARIIWKQATPARPIGAPAAVSAQYHIEGHIFNALAFCIFIEHDNVGSIGECSQ